uniref:Retrotransposon gag domain-containing protein n=1 Tax=Brassica oleracea var. oleracea TaxID=109376 RepID=A0A0D3E4T0_BRAOL
MAPRPNEWTQMQQFLEDFQKRFQDNMRRTMAEAIQTGVQAGVQAAFTANAANAANAPQQRNLRNNNPVFDEHEEDCDEENPFGDNNQHNQIRGRQNMNGDDPRWFSGIKIDIPKFHGGSQPEELLDWFVTVDEFIEFKDVPEQKRVPLVTTRFRGHAASWWSQVKLSRSRRGKEKITSWDKLKKHMRKTFIPYNFECFLFQRFHNIRQGSQPVEEYANEFYQMLTRVDIHDSEDQLVAHFIAGLRPQLQNMLHQFDPGSVSEARQRALLVEQQTRLGAGQWAGNNRARTPTDDSKPTTSRDNTTTTTPTGPRQNTEPTETTAAAIEPRPSGPNALRCFTCGERCHIQTACPNNGRRGLIANDREITGEPVYDDDEDQYDDTGEEQVYGDTGTCLMLHRNCLAPKTDEAWQRTSLFTSTCTVKGKVCRFVIDSGCSANVVSEEAVRKLALTPEAHPHPYRLLWMQTRAEPLWMCLTSS